jgi:hypothetical protein
VLSHDQIEEMLAAHRLYVETERRQGRRADFALTAAVLAPLLGIYAISAAILHTFERAVMTPAQLAADNLRRRIVRLVILGAILVALIYLLGSAPSPPALLAS